MARNFPANGDVIKCSNGTAGALTGAITMVIICQVAAARDSAWRSLLTMTTAGGAAAGYGMEVDSANKFGITIDGTQDTAPTITMQSSDGWCLLSASKASGSSTPRSHKYKYSTNAFTHENGSTGKSNPTNSTSGGKLEIGGEFGGSGDYFRGDIAVAAIWDRVLTDAEIENLPFTLQAWIASNPQGLWLLDQGTTGQKVLDLTGNGANESSLIGTSAAAGSVPVFNYGGEVWVPTKPAAAGGDATVSHVAGVATMSGGTQVVSATSTVTHVAGVVTMSGGTQTIGAGAGVVHVAGVATMSGGTQTVGATSTVTGVAGIVTMSGGTQIVSGTGSATVDQVAGITTMSGGTHTLSATSSLATTAGVVTMSGGTHTIDNGTGTTTVPLRTLMRVGT